MGMSVVVAASAYEYRRKGEERGKEEGKKKEGGKEK